jgi:hypothetical protein
MKKFYTPYFSSISRRKIDRSVAVLLAFGRDNGSYSTPRRKEIGGEIWRKKIASDIYPMLMV